MNLSYVANAGVTRQACERLVADRTVSTSACRTAFRGPAAYTGAFPHPTQYGAAATDRLYKSTGQPNFNASLYIDVASRYQHDAIELLRHGGAAAITRAELAAYTDWAQPGDDSLQLRKVRAPIATYADWFDRLVLLRPVATGWNDPARFTASAGAFPWGEALGSVSYTILALFGFAIYGAIGGVAPAPVGRRRRAVRVHRRRGPARHVGRARQRARLPGEQPIPGGSGAVHARAGGAGSGGPAASARRPSAAVHADHGDPSASSVSAIPVSPRYHQGDAWRGAVVDLDQPHQAEHGEADADQGDDPPDDGEPTASSDESHEPNPRGTMTADETAGRRRHPLATRTALGAAAIVVGAFVVHLPGFVHQLFDSDKGAIATMGMVLGRGGTLYRDVIDRKPPIPAVRVRGLVPRHRDA